MNNTIQGSKLSDYMEEITEQVEHYEEITRSLSEAFDEIEEMKYEQDALEDRLVEIEAGRFDHNDVDEFEYCLTDDAIVARLAQIRLDGLYAVEEARTIAETGT
jgi:CCR4-NOT transcriptional regulation complex NOT5 subunit